MVDIINFHVILIDNNEAFRMAEGLTHRSEEADDSGFEGQAFVRRVGPVIVHHNGKPLPLGSHNTQVRRYRDPDYDHCLVGVDRGEPYFFKAPETTLQELESQGVPSFFYAQPDNVTLAYHQRLAR